MSAVMVEYETFENNAVRFATIEDTANIRLEEWAKWFGRGRPVGPAQPRCTLGRVQSQRVAAGQTGAPPDLPASVEEVEKAVLRTSLRVRKLIETFYCEYSTMDQKAKQCGLTRNGYWRALQRAKRMIYAELY